MKDLNSASNNKSSLLLLIFALIVGGVSAQATGILNTSSGGYLICVNSKTKVVTHPGTSTCPKGSKKLVLGAQGVPGTNGLDGAAGLPGKDGKDGKTLWNGVKDPESTWGAPGDMFINSLTKTLFGPKNLDGTWPVGVLMVGPKGDQGPVGLPGATGAQGPIGLTGATGAQGPIGLTGATGAQGSSATLTCALGGTCAVGDLGPGGGIVFYVQTPTAAAPWRYMEVAPNTWSDGSADPQMKWCSITNVFVPNLLTGATSSQQTSFAFGAGYSNTQKMLRGCIYGAANAAASYNGGGKSDWHLPSYLELLELYARRSTVGMNNYFYWSSYEGGSLNAYAKSFSSGGEGAVSKNLDAYVRPVRAF